MPPSDVPGERTALTQPFPTKPPAFDRQGFSEDDLIDFTPELRAEALAGIEQFRMGPIYTPPSLANAPDGTRGTLMLPTQIGGANWEGGSYDPETGILYVASHTNAWVMAIQSEPDVSDIRYIRGGGGELPWLEGLPLVKPPWGRITAIDMNRGEMLWQIPNGPTPDDVANNPALAGLDIPPTGTPTRAPTLVTESLLFSAPGWGAQPLFRAHDKATGEVLAEIELPGAVGGLPMTYMIAAGSSSSWPSAGSAARSSSHWRCPTNTACRGSIRLRRPGRLAIAGAAVCLVPALVQALTALWTVEDGLPLQILDGIPGCGPVTR